MALGVEDIQVLFADRAAAVDSSHNVNQAWHASRAAVTYSDDVSECWTPQDRVPLKNAPIACLSY